MTPGRNDPCSCGSGRKFKRCCGGVASASDASRRAVAADMPTIVNNDGHLTVYTISDYEVFDAESVAVGISTWRPKPDLDEKRDRDGRLLSFEAHYQRKPVGRRGPADRVLVARLELNGDSMIVETNSTERDLEIREKLTNLAGKNLRLRTTQGRSAADLLSEPLSEEEARQAQREQDELAGNPEVQARLMDMMSAYSGQWCDTPIPALKNRRPRTLVRTEAGKAKVVALIREMESRPRPAGGPGMDFGLIRRELGLPPAR